MNKRSQFLQKLLLQILQKVRWRQSWQGRQAGLTVIEILVAAIIAVIMITLLLGFMNQLLRTNRREQILTETQQEMQTALNYIAREMKSAVHVYDGPCLAGTDGSDDDSDPDCPGIFDTSNDFSLPDTTPSNAVPILAFWTLEPLPDNDDMDNDLVTMCQNATDNNPATIDGDIVGPEQDGTQPTIPIPCVSGKMPTLVVYFLSRANPDNRWDGLARIVRYELPRYNSDGEPVNGYISPNDPRTNYQQWPFPTDEDNPTDAIDGAASGEGQADAVVLTDFVDDPNEWENLNIDDSNIANPNCPNNYEITPTTETLSNNNFDDVRSFYACIGPGQAAQGAISRRSILFLRGNASGKGEGIASPEDGFLPALSTEVVNRGVFRRIPR
jgi:type II secretory pathway pseudopilin PulG